ncbi:HAMP domain-containing histidine kinase [Sphingobium sufflavum]|uniref:sensor histidine kinase n=1 Tax=Sphingobium sufflavum TaxID=1129547 RepID=UPI001F40B099|nr:HAMP domain-containing sensor histidine kinase [Sphingobium sufflavum]MCE7796383.1 HAMP domain-containing histidine kinase [Sphingobium sufflavum]
MRLSGFSLRRLTLAFLSLLLLSTVATGVGIYSVTVRTIRQLVDTRIRQISVTLAPDGEPHDRAELIRRIAEMNRQRDTGDLGIILVAPGHRQLAGNVRLSRDLPPGLASVDLGDNIKGLSKGRALVRDLPDGLRLIVVAETEPFDQYDRARIRIYMGGFGSILAIVLGGLILFSRMVSRRITAMRDTVATIIEGDMSQRVPVTGDGSEFDLQAAAFNRMLDRIQVLMAEISNVSNDISHELRTPLTRLRGRLALLHKQAESDGAREGIGAALEDADDLLGMFTAILRISEIESGERRRGFAPVDLAELASEIVAMMEPVAEDSGHDLTLVNWTPATIIGDRKLLAQLLLNLVENALRHTPPGTAIAATVTRTGGHAEITVTDTGPGIPPAQRAVALRRFGRLGHGGAAGHGLGLALVDAIARLHGGEVRLDSPGQGLRISIILPME